jgi:HEPN domain-containing protein
MTEPPFEPDDYRRWLQMARGNLKLAAVRDPEVPFEELCYNAQQAAEKAVKGVFVNYTGPFHTRTTWLTCWTAWLKAV